MIASIHLSLIGYSLGKCLFTDKCDKVNREALCDIISVESFLGFVFYLLKQPFLEVTIVELRGESTAKILFISNNSTMSIDYAVFHTESN